MAASSSASTSSSSSTSDLESERPAPKPSKRKLEESDSDEESESESSGSEAESSVAVKSKRTSKKFSNKEGVEGDDVEEGEDVQVLSHKAQRRLKKKQKLLESGSKDEETPSATISKKGKSKSKEAKGEKKEDLPKRQNSVWVGNLSFRTTPDSLRTFFEGVGEITRVHMPMKAGAGGKGAKSENRGFAYVDFVTPDAKTIAITLSEKNLDGRRLLIKDGDDFTGRPAPPAAAPGSEAASATAATGTNAGHSKTAQKILSAQKQPPGPCLFLGNLGFEATDEKIRQMMEGHAKALALWKKGKEKKDGKSKGANDQEEDGDPADTKMDVDEPTEGTTKDRAVSVGIKKVRMGTFEDSGLCKGFAFVDFTSTTHATNALINPRNHFLDGRKLKVEYASSDAARRGGYREPGASKGEKSGPRKPRLDRGDKDAQGTHRNRREPEETGAGGQVDHDNGEATAQRQRPQRVDRDTKPHHRPRPGAALALAKRENVAIVPSQGTRITFD